MAYDPVIWTIVIICKIILLLAILFCCTHNRRKRRNLQYQQTLIANNVTTYSQPIVPVPHNYQTQPGVHNANVYQPQAYNTKPPEDLPPSYSEIFNQTKS